MKILIASRNPGKVNEFRSLFAELPFEIVGLDEFMSDSGVQETGATYAENARLKASGYARQMGLLTVADDSGLEVAALGGRPGVFSARFAGYDTGFDVKIPRLLMELELSHSNDRSARFVAHMAVASPAGEIVFEAEGTCEGTIAQRACGSNGFGYDPIFIPDGFDKTFGQLSDEIKHSASHRARAAAKIIQYLRDSA